MSKDRNFKKIALTQEELKFLLDLREEVYEKKTDDKVRKRVSRSEYLSILSFRKESFENKQKVKDEIIKASKLEKENSQLKAQLETVKPLLEFEAQKGVVDFIEIVPKKKTGKRETVAIVSLSDWHYEETVMKDSVMGMNEFNPNVAKQRAINCFSAIKKLVEHQQINFNINQVVIGLLGDFIGGWIHDELMQTNSKSPLAAVQECKSVLVSGLRMLHEELKVDKITVVGVVGNHGRTTKKNQFANATDVNYEYYLYKDIEEICKAAGLNKFEFIIPKSEMVNLKVFDKSLLFTHGSHIKYGGGIGGLAVPLNRWIAQFSKTYKFDMLFIGHFHQLLFLGSAVVNGSLKGYDGYAFGKGLPYERPQQNMVLLDSEYGFCSYIPIYVD